MRSTAFGCLLGVATIACQVDVDPTGFAPVASGPTQDAATSSSTGDTETEASSSAASSSSTGDAGSGTSEPAESSTSDADTGSDGAGSSGEGSSSGVVEPPPPSCDSIYGDVEDYELCAEEADRCRFMTDLDGDTCAELCQDLGTTCFGAQATDEDEGICVDLGENHDCNTEEQIEICICSRA